MDPARLVGGTQGTAQELTTPTDADERLDLPTEGIDLESLEQHLVVQALRRTRGNRGRAARLPGMNRHQMRYRIKKFDLAEFRDESV